MPDLPRPAGEKEQGAPFVTHESMGRSLGSQKKVLGRVIGVEKRLGNAEKKITIMKNIMKMRKSSDNIGNTIKGIAESVESIAETTTEQYDLEKDKAEDARLAGEKDDAKKDEKNLEKGWGSFKSGAEKVLKPVTSLFEKLANFVKTFLLGGAVLSLMEWFGNPENTGKIQTLFRFFKDWWPILVTGLILFVGTILGPGALWIAGIALVAATIPSIINGVKSIFGMGKDIDKDLDDKKGEKLAQEGVDGVEKGSSSEMQESQNKVDEMKNLQEPQQFNKGGPVPGKGDKDTVPAMLTPGEFVMSKGAVQKYGSDTLAGMNAAAGGTNMPTMGRYSGGGFANITNTETTSSTDSDGNFSFGMNYVSPEEAKERIAEMGMPSMVLMDGTVIPDFGKMGGESVTQGLQLTRDIMVENGAPPEKIAQLDEVMAMPDAQPDSIATMVNQLVPGSMENTMMNVGADISASAKMKGGGLVQGLASGGQVRRMGRGASKKRMEIKKGINKPNVKSIKTPVKKSSVVAYNEQAQAAGGGYQSKSGGNNDVPNFNAAAKRSLAKIKTLGISV